MWSGAQQSRLAVEKQLLEKSFRGVQWYDSTSKGATKVDVDFTTNVGGGYTLRLYVPADWPNSCPALAIARPSMRLKLRHGEDLPISSHAYHTYGLSDEGYQCLCHYHPSSWNPNNTMYLVFLKGRLWLEAYENHMKTGKSIDRYLKPM